jgi:uncharacterized protein (TIGR04255 family)
MSETTTPFPDFDAPPVTEVVLGVQFDAIKGLRTPQIGALWQEFKDRLPITEEHPPLDTVIERFGAGRKPMGAVQLQMLDALPTPRCWFLNETGTELIQVQPDRFIRNWRKVGDGDAYPHYDTRLRQAFMDDFGRFAAFVDRERLGELVPNQCEVSYVNLIEPGEVWREHGEADKVLTVLCQRYSDGFLGKPEDMRTALRFVLHDSAGEAIGRLHVSLDPVYRLKDEAPMLRLNLTARGRPIGPEIDGIMGFLDLGREWVVRGFASITTTEMHKAWRRRDAR